MPVLTESEEYQQLLAQMSALPPSVRAAALQKHGNTVNALQKQGPLWASGHAPPPFDIFCELLDGCPLHPRQYEAFARAGVLSPEFLFEKARVLSEFLLLWGKGGGKNYSFAKFVAWIGLCCLSTYGSLQKRVGLASSTNPIAFMNCAVNEVQAKETFFDAYLRPNLMHKMFDPWRDQLEMTEKGNRAMFRSHNFCLLSGHSHMQGLEGYNVMGGIMDEFDAWEETLTHSDADSMYRILQTSSLTRMTKFTPLIFMTTYTRTKIGPAMRMKGRFEEGIAEALKEGKNPHQFLDVASTMELRPDFDFNQPAVKEMYKHDNALARAMFECMPMEAEGAFFEFSERIDSSMDPSLRPCAEWEEHISTVTLQNGQSSEVVGVSLGHVTKVPGRVYFLGGDGAYTGDMFALSVFHVETARGAIGWLCPSCGGHGNSNDDPLQIAMRGESNYRMCAETEAAPASADIRCGVCMNAPYMVGMKHDLQFRIGRWWRNQAQEEPVQIETELGHFQIPRVVEDLLITFKPQRASRPGETNKPIDFESPRYGVRAIVLRLFQDLGIRQGRFDVSHAVSVFQHIRQNGFDADAISFSNAEQFRRGRLMKVLIYDGGVSFLHPNAMPNATMRKAVETGETELKQVRRIGQKLDHPANGSKDTLDARFVAGFLAAVYAVPALAACYTSKQEKES